MTTRANKRRRCVFLWKIENISHCWLERGKWIESPRFIADALESTKWFLRLYPSGHSNENYIGFYLRRENDCVGPDAFEATYQLAIMDEDGDVLKTMGAEFEKWIKGSSYGSEKFVEREKVFITQRELFLPKDTLTVVCVIWKDDRVHPEENVFRARTVFKVWNRNFMWKIDNFSSLKSGLINKFKDTLVEFDLVLNEGLDFEKKLVIKINSFEDSIKYFSFKASTIDSKGEKENCGTHEYFASDLRGNVISTVIFTKKLMENKSRYLVDDVLTLDFEYKYSDGNVSYEYCGCGRISHKLKNEVVESGNENNTGNEKSQAAITSPKLTNEVVESGNGNNTGKEISRIISVMANDFKFMYNDQIFSDIELRTSTKTFSAHKSILSARSPVFRKMFSNDMKENNSGHVDITDMEDDTIHRMLLYIYTDTLDDMQFDNACKLFVAADKYEILALKSSCSSFLEDNLCPKKACDVLALADQHQDDHLKSVVQDFILKYDKKIFGSMEWKQFMATNVQLAADVMYCFTQKKV